jgi:hypothetical protein
VAAVKPFLVYTGARFVVFGACVLATFVLFRVFAGDDFSVLLPLLIGAVASVLVSAWLLRGLRDDFVATVQRRAERAVTAHESREAGEPRQRLDSPQD